METPESVAFGQLGHADDWPDRTQRDAESTPTEEGAEYLKKLHARLREKSETVEVLDADYEEFVSPAQPVETNILTFESGGGRG